MIKFSLTLLAILVVVTSFGSRVAHAILINVAPIYGTATASGFLSHRPPELAINDDPLTLWNDTRHGSQINPSWLIVDLHGSFYVKEVVLQSPDNDNTFLGLSNVYNFSVSNDGVNWSYIVSGTLFDSDVPAEYSDIIPIPSAHSLFRYAQYDVVGGSHWGHLGEMEIYADLSAVPEPVTFALVGLGLAGIGLARRRKLNA